MIRSSSGIAGTVRQLFDETSHELLTLALGRVARPRKLAAGLILGATAAQVVVAGIVPISDARTDLREVTEHTAMIPGVVLSVACPADESRMCAFADDSFTVPIRVGAGTTPIVGGQFHLAYDTACLRLDAVDPGSTCDPASPFELEVFEQANPVAGRVFYATGIGFSGVATVEATTLACATFSRLTDCGACDVCLTTVAGAPTYLTGPGGQLVPAEFVGDGCGCQISGVGDILLEVPASSSHDSACHTPTAQVTWSPPTAEDPCEGPLDVACTCSHSNPLVPQATCQGWVAGGGEIPQGRADFCCSAANSCGQSASACWSVTVGDSMTFRAIVQLSPAAAVESFDRCVEFVLHRSCVEAPIINQAVLTFGAPGQAIGHAEYDFSVPSADYGCITARDPLHTLRTRGRLECAENGAVEALFTGAPGGEGSWLIAGNLDADHDVDILDFGAMMGQFLTLAPPDSDCTQTAGSSFVHADLNGDGIVDGLDFAFIESYLGMTDVATCCPNDGGADGPSIEGAPPVMSIHLRALRRDDRARVLAGDLNDDGVLDEADLGAFRAGVLPRQ